MESGHQRLKRPLWYPQIRNQSHVCWSHLKRAPSACMTSTRPDVQATCYVTLGRSNSKTGRNIDLKFLHSIYSMRTNEWHRQNCENNYFSFWRPSWILMMTSSLLIVLVPSIPKQPRKNFSYHKQLHCELCFRHIPNIPMRPPSSPIRILESDYVRALLPQRPYQYSVKI